MGLGNTPQYRTAIPGLRLADVPERFAGLVDNRPRPVGGIPVDNEYFPGVYEWLEGVAQEGK